MATFSSLSVTSYPAKPEVNVHPSLVGQLPATGEATKAPTSAQLLLSVVRVPVHVPGASHTTALQPLRLYAPDAAPQLAAAGPSPVDS